MRTVSILLLFFCFSAYGQQAVPFQQMRYDEDYSIYENDTLRDLYPRVKYMKIDKDAYVSFGGSFRVQYLIMDNEGWNHALRDKDGYLLTRLLLHADLHLSKRLRIFAEVQSALANSRNHLIPVEKNPLEPHQLFVDYQPFNRIPLTLRAGRQELSYGSERLISVRDAPNSRRSFDGIKAILRKGKVDTDVFYMRPVIDKAGIFDDTSSPDLKLWGGFSDISISRQNLTVNFHYLGFYNSRALFNDGGGVETRHTLAARIVKNGRRWRYDLEEGYQFGAIGDRKIAARSTALATSYRFNEMLYSPEIGLKADIISGDRNSTDKQHQTLNPLFAAGAYF